MMRSCRGLILLAILMLGLNMLPACAQTAKDAKTSDTVTMDMRDIDIRAAIEALFRNSGKNFAVDANVEGVIPSVSFKDVPFDIALKNLLKSSGLIYRVDHNVYIISKRPETAQTTFETPPTEVPVADTEESTVRIEKVTLNYSSPREILDMMSNSSRGYGGGYGMGNGSNYGGGYGGGYGGMNGGGYGGFGGMNGGFGGGYGGFGGSNGGYNRGYGGYGSGGYSGGWNQSGIIGGSGRSHHRSW